MKGTTRRTRSATRSQKSRTTNIPIKREIDSGITNTDPSLREIAIISSLAPIVKTEEDDLKLESNPPRLKIKKGV